MAEEDGTIADLPAPPELPALTPDDLQFLAPDDSDESQRRIQKLHDFYTRLFEITKHWARYGLSGATVKITQNITTPQTGPGISPAPIVISGSVGPRGVTGPEAQSYYPWTHGVPYDTLRATTANTTTGGSWRAYTAAVIAEDGSVTTQEVPFDGDWEAVNEFEFHRLDKDGRDWADGFGSVDFQSGNLVIAIRHLDVDENIHVAAFRTTDAARQNVYTDTNVLTYKIPVERLESYDRPVAPATPDPNNPVGPLAIQPQVGSSYVVRVLLPFLYKSPTFNVRSVGGAQIFWTYIEDVLIAENLGNTDPAADWEADVVALANAAVPGERRLGDIVIMYRGSLRRQKSWGQEAADQLFKWVEVGPYISGNMIVPGAINAAHIAAGTITAGHIDTNLALIRSELQLDNGVIRFRHLHPSLLRDLRIGDSEGFLPPVYENFIPTFNGLAAGFESNDDYEIIVPTGRDREDNNIWNVETSVRWHFVGIQQPDRDPQPDDDFFNSGIDDGDYIALVCDEENWAVYRVETAIDASPNLTNISVASQVVQTYYYTKQLSLTHIHSDGQNIAINSRCRFSRIRFFNLGDTYDASVEPTIAYPKIRLNNPPWRRYISDAEHSR